MPAKRTFTQAASLLAATLGLAGAIAGSAAAATPPAPTISDLPSIVRQGTGTTTLAVAFPRSPDAATLRAAIAAASAFSGLTGRGVTIVSVVHPSQAQLEHSPMSVIELDPRSGPTHISLRYLTHGNLLLKLSGQGRSLLNAARLLSTKWIAGLSSSSVTVGASLTAAVAKLSATGGTEAIGAANANASGGQTLTLTRHVDIPVDKVIDKGDALLRLGVEYNAPGGGRLTFKLNGHTLGAGESRGAGNTFDYRFKLASVWTDGPNLQPGYYLAPGENTITVSATPADHKLAGQVGTQLALTPESDLQMTLTERRPVEQLDLWPFPLYDGSWQHTTVVMHPASRLGQRSLSALITALANTERLTGAPADPQISYGKPTAAAVAGNVLVFGNSKVLAGITPDAPVVPGLITEQQLTGGGIALLVTDNRAIEAFGGEYFPGIVNGKTVVIDSRDHAHTITAAPRPQAFATPRTPWLKPAAGLAALVLAWIGVRVFLARRRLRARPEMPTGGVLS